MVWALKSWRDGSVENNTEDSLEFAFIGYKSERQKARFSLLTVQQSKAIAHFLQFWANHTEQIMAEYCLPYNAQDNPLNQALGYYWGQFL